MNTPDKPKGNEEIVQDMWKWFNHCEHCDDGKCNPCLMLAMKEALDAKDREKEAEISKLQYAIGEWKKEEDDWIEREVKLREANRLLLIDTGHHYDTNKKLREALEKIIRINGGSSYAREFEDIAKQALTQALRETPK